jgi:hypothetical protein
MTDARSAWSEAGQQLTALTSKLKDRYEQQRAAEAQRGPAGDAAEPLASPSPDIGTAGDPPVYGTEPTTSTSSSERTKADIQDAVRRLGEAAREVFEALGSAAKDPNVKDDVKQVGNSVTVAFGATFNEISEELRKAYGKASEKVASSGTAAKGSTSDTASPGSGSSWSSATDDIPSGGTPPAETPPADAPPPSDGPSDGGQPPARD